MKASKFIEDIERKHDIAILMDGGVLRVMEWEKLPQFLRLAIAGHRERLAEYLTTQIDVELTITKCRAELEKFGFYQMSNGEWTSPDGDDYMDEVLAGLLDPADVEAAAVERQAQRRLEAAAMGVPPQHLPPKVTIEATEVSPGRYRWTEPAGVRARIVYKGRVIAE